jgi:hypothetical protein
MGRRAGKPNKKPRLEIPASNIEGLCSSNEFDPDLWWNDYPDNENTSGRTTKLNTNKSIKDSRLALRICDRCPSKSACLDEGMRPENLEWGIWGGLTSGERLVRANAVGASDYRRHKVRFANLIRAGRPI